MMYCTNLLIDLSALKRYLIQAFSARVYALYLDNAGVVEYRGTIIF